MFSKDIKHNRPTPRSTSQAFGPYHQFAPPAPPVSKLWTVAGVLLIGAAFGLLIGWRG